MGSNGCGCPGNGSMNGNPFAMDAFGTQNGNGGMYPGMFEASGLNGLGSSSPMIPGTGAYLLEATRVDLGALRSPPKLDAASVLLGSECLTSSIRDGLST